MYKMMNTIISNAIILNFNNETIEINDDCGCIFIKELLTCDNHENKFNIPRDSTLFKNFILNNGLEYTDVSEYNTNEFEILFQEFGYYGAEKQLDLLRKMYKKTITGRMVNKKSVQNLLSRFPENIKHLNIYRNPNIDRKFLEQYKIDKNFDYTSKCVFLEESYYNKHSKQFSFHNWQIISSNENIPESFLRRNIFKLNFRDVSKHKKLSEEFLNEFLPQMSWENLGTNPSVSEEFIVKYENRIPEDLNYVKFENPNISEKFIEDRKDEIEDWTVFQKHPLLSTEFFVRHAEKIFDIINQDFGIVSEADYNISTFQIFHNHKNHNLTIELFLRLKHLLGPEKNFWSAICLRKNLPRWFLEQNIEKFNWKILSCNSSIPEDFFIKNFDRVNIKFLSSNSAMSERFIRKNIELFDMDGLSKNSSLSEAFFVEHILQINVDNLFLNPFRAYKTVDFSQDILSKYLN